MPETPKTIRSTRIYIRPVTHRQAVEAFNNLQPVREGLSELIRFSVGRRIQHLILMISVSALAVTGLVQTFDNTRIGQALLILLGGLEGTRKIHHFFALILIGLAVYHFLNVLDGYFVKRLPASMLPVKSDLRHIFQMLTFNLGLTRKLPIFDRYSFDEKFVYWVTAITVVILSLSGLVLWFPYLVTQVLPGSFYLFAGALHRWQAIFIVVVILLLHIYQVLLRKQNFSIFNGRMPLSEMKADHPVELAFLERAATLTETKKMPVMVKFSIDEMVVNKEPRKKKVKPSTSKSDLEPIQAVDAPVEADQPETVGNPEIIPPSGEAVK